MKRSISAAIFAASTVLAACGGGTAGGLGNGAGGGLPPDPTRTPGATTAQGTLVDDPAGTPLSGIPVRLDPWVAYPTPGPTPTPIAVTTTDPNGHFTISAQDGTYMLVIGTDTVNTPPPGWTTPAPSATDTPIPGASGWRATIHDKLVLIGQTTLFAPTMPPQPLYAPPAAETTGAYRLATIDALTEAPCILAYNQDRVSLNLPPAVDDEWLQENVRAMLHSVIAWNTQNPSGGDVIQFLTDGSGHTSVSGGGSCAASLLPGNFAGQSQTLNANATWFGGAYTTYENNTQGAGFAEFPIDPRIYVQSSTTTWP